MGEKKSLSAFHILILKALHISQIFFFLPQKLALQAWVTELDLHKVLVSHPLASR